MNCALFLIRVNKTSITKIKRYSEIGSTWGAPLFNWKSCAIFSLLIMQDSDLFKMASIQLIKLFYFFFTKTEFFKYSKVKKVI